MTTDPQYLNLIQNNLPQYIKSDKLGGQIRKDDQGYSILIVQENVNKDNVKVTDISCNIINNDNLHFDEMTKGTWSRGTCPCNGAGCILDVSNSMNTVEYDLTGRNIDKLVVKDAEIEGTQMNGRLVQLVRTHPSHG